MPLLRRLRTFAIGLMLLQGNLAAVMLPCATEHGASGTRYADAVDELAIPHTAMGQEVADAGAVADATPGNQCDHRDHPDKCAAMVSCAAVGIPAAPGEFGQRLTLVQLAIITKSEGLLSCTLPPVVPPPRV